MEKVKKPVVDRVVSWALWRIMVALVYITGLSLLIPVAFFYLFPESLGGITASQSNSLVLLSLGMVSAGILVSIWHFHSVGKALKSLGRITIIPGLLGIVVSIFGRDVILLYLASTVPGFLLIKDVIALYLDRSVPGVRYLTIGFFVFGAVLWLLGDKISNGKKKLLPKVH